MGPGVPATAQTPWVSGGILPAGNYEWPFELMLPGTTAESVEGLPEGSITYKLKATVARGKLAYDLHTYKRLRIVRTLEPSALEFLHAMSVENIWPNKIEYSIIVPQKAVVFGSSIAFESRFTPLLKGLELGDIAIRLIEVHELIVDSSSGQPVRELRKEKEVQLWTIPITREEHWQDMIEDTGQEGWVMNASLDLPKKLGGCLQDVNCNGIKIRHKLKLVLSLKNPDGHISELRATLPVTIFISPNMPLDEDGNLVRQMPLGSTSVDMGAGAPPTYSEHVLDQLYEDIVPSGMQTPATPSGFSSPTNGHSRVSSSDNLASMMNLAFTPAALSSRLQGMSLDQSSRNSSFIGATHAMQAAVSQAAASQAGTDSAYSSAPPSAPLTRHNSDERDSDSADHIDVAQISKVPSYQTAIRAPVRRITDLPGCPLPDYITATSAPNTPDAGVPVADPMAAAGAMIASEPSSPTYRRRHMAPAARRRRLSISMLPQLWHHGDSDEPRRLHLIQGRDRVV